MKRTLIYILLLICPVLLFAQKESPDVRKGNRQYNKEQYTDAGSTDPPAVIQSCLGNIPFADKAGKERNAHQG